MSGFDDIDLSGLDPLTLIALEELARKQWELQMIQAQKEQDRLAKELANTEVTAVDGFGPMVRRVHADAFHDWARKEKRNGGYDIWKDNGFTRYFDKIAPECKVKYAGKPQVGWGPELEPVAIEIHGCAENKRWVKKYPQTVESKNELRVEPSGTSQLSTQSPLN